MVSLSSPDDATVVSASRNNDGSTFQVGVDRERVRIWIWNDSREVLDLSFRVLDFLTLGFSYLRDKMVVGYSRGLGGP